MEVQRIAGEQEEVLGAHALYSDIDQKVMENCETKLRGSWVMGVGVGSGVCVMVEEEESKLSV